MPVLDIEKTADLPNLSKAALREQWRKLFHRYPPAKMRRSLLIPILAYKIQEQNSGSLAAGICGRLRHLARSIASDPSNIPFVPMIKPGTRLVRRWRGQVHLVTVESRGYEYQGSRYQSLSEIARRITGTRWSGPLFFGLKRTREKQGLYNSKETE